MSAPWFHVLSIPPAGGSVTLDRDEARHALGVRRLGAGDSVTVFDGAGTVARAVLAAERARDGSVVARVEEARSVPRSGVDLVVGVAPPKGDRFATLLDMLGQLGVRKVVPLETAHGVVDAGAINRTRAGRILMEACKQSRSAWLSELGPAVGLEAFVRQSVSEGRAVFVADQGGEAAPAAAPGPVALVIGPEGGLASAELHAAAAGGARSLGLGSGVLRVETAAVAAASLFRARPDAPVR